MSEIKPFSGGMPRRFILLLIALTAIGPMSLNIIVPALPTIATTLESDPGRVQLLISLYLVGLATSQLVLGPLSDRFGRRPIILLGLRNHHDRQPGGNVCNFHHRLDDRADRAVVRRLDWPGCWTRDDPRPLWTRTRNGDDRPRDHRHGGGSDADTVDRRRHRDILRMARRLSCADTHRRCCCDLVILCTA